MHVKSSRLLEDRRIGFLNSSKNYRDDDSFTVVMFEEVLEKFAAQDIDDPPAHYLNKRIEFTGDVRLRRGKPQIILTSPKDIKILKSETSPSEDKAA